MFKGGEKKYFPLHFIRNILNFCNNVKQEGRSPEEKGKGPMQPIIENPRGIIWTTLVEDLLMMLYIKYERPCSFRQEDFWKFNFKTYLLTPLPTYAANWNGLNNIGRGTPRDHSCEVWSKSNEQFQRRRCLSKQVDGRRTTTDDGQRPVTIAHPDSQMCS